MDIVLYVSCLLAGTAAYFAAALLPAAAIWLMTEQVTITGLVAILTLVATSSSGTSQEVHGLSIDASGLTFQRRAGKPMRLGWSEIRSIAPASRRDVVVNGWLWPFYRPREATRCMSGLGHFRIEYTDGYCFFPPENEAEFLGALNHWRARAAPGV